MPCKLSLYKSHNSHEITYACHIDIAYHSTRLVIRDVGRGALGHGQSVPLGAEGALCDRSAPSNRECVYRENVVGGRPPTTQSPSEKSLQSNGDRTAPFLGEVSSVPPPLSRFSKYVAVNMPLDSLKLKLTDILYGPKK